ncbi:MAG: hypothetical protein HDS16_05260 [Bacteroides sp.]|nr:hypothetical protein [Bacteroides sp.]
MKKEQILSTLNGRLGAEGIKTDGFQRTFNAYIDANLPAEGTEPDEAYWNKHTTFLKSLSGQFSHDVAEQVKAQTKNVPPAPKGGESDEKRYSALEEKFDKLMKSHEALAEQLTQQESKRTQEQLISQVKAEMKKQGATDEYVLKQTLRGVTLDAKKSVADLAKEMLTAYDSEYTACRGKGAAPHSGNQGGGGNAKNAADAFFARKQKKEGWGNSQKK